MMRDKAAREHGSRVLKLLALLVVGVLVLHPTMALAQYVVSPSVIAGGGARMTGGGYVVTGTTGQSTPVGVSSGGSYITQHGFWHAAAGGGGALNPMVLDIDLINSTTARISWNAVVEALYYDLYWSTTPYFTSATGTFWVTVNHPTTYRDFSFGIGDTATNYYFTGVARNDTETASDSNIVGEFDFGTSASAVGFDLTGPGVATNR
jgi:hypothetical protein